jgi:hypothetical protein
VSADSGSWKTIAMRLPRTFAIRASSRPISSSPSSMMDPSTTALAGSSPVTAVADADLPEPDSPTMPRTSPRWSS